MAARLEFTDQHGHRLYLNPAPKNRPQFAYCHDCATFIGNVDTGPQPHGFWPLANSIGGHQRARPDHKVTLWVVGGRVAHNDGSQP